MAHFGETIRRLMRERHVTMRQLARQAMVSLDTISRVVKMKEPAVNPTTYCSLAAGLGLTPTELDGEVARGTPRPQRTGSTTEQDRAPRSVPGQAPDTADQVRRRVHAAVDLLDMEGLMRMEEAARGELRRKLLTDVSINPPLRAAAAKVAGQRTHAVTRVARVEDVQRAARKPGHDK